MKRILLLLLSVACVSQLLSQTNIFVGTGTVAPSVGTNPGSGANGASPYGICVGSGSMGKKLQIIYTAAQINSAMTTAGYTPGPSFIHNIAWDISAHVGGSNYNYAGYTIKMANVAQSLFANTSSAYTGAMTTVWGPTAQTYGTSGTGFLVTHTFGTPFQWDGTSNLLVEVCYTISGVLSASTYGGVRRTSTASNQMIYNGGASINCATSTYATVVAAIPNARLNVSSATPCAGTPSLSSAETTTVCATQSTNIGLTGLAGAADYAYLWKSSTTPGGPYTPASGTNTNSTYDTPIPLPADPTYYVCEVTCLNSSLTTTSTEGLVSVDDFLNCYCISNFSAAAATSVRGLRNVSLDGNTININNSTAANTSSPSPYTLYSTPVADLSPANTYTLSTNVGTATNVLHYVSAWIDYNQDGLFGGYTSGGVPSANADFNPSGINERIITVGPTANVTSNTNFTVPAGALSGNTAMRVRYRYGGTLAGIGACQQLTGAATSGGAGEVEDYRVFIASSCTAPATNASASNVSGLATTSATITWTSGDGTGGRLILLKEGSAVNANPISGTSYTASSTFTSGDQLGTGNYVIYDGTSSSTSVSGLLPSTTYYYSIFEYNTASTCYVNTGHTGSFTTSSCSPATNASAPVFSDILNNTMTLSFTRGSGTNVLVLARSGSAVNDNPDYNTSYTANAAFGSGQQIGTGNFVVYNGTGNSVILTGLSNTTTYHFAVYEYNASPNCYSTTPLIANASTLNPTSGLGTPALNCLYTRTGISGLGFTTIVGSGGSTQVATGTAIDDQNYAGQTFSSFANGAGFNFNFNGNTYNSFGINANGFVWFGTGQPGATYASFGGLPIASANANLGGSGTIDGLIAAAGADLISHYHLSVTPNPSRITVVVTGTAPNRICKIEWTGFQAKSLGNNSTCWSLLSYSDDSRLDFQIWLYESGGSLSNRIECVYRDQGPFCVYDSYAFQVGIRGTSNAAYLTHTTNLNSAGSNGTASGTVNNTSSVYINGNRSVRFDQTLSIPTTTPVSVASNTCPSDFVSLTSSSGSSNQWFKDGALLPGPESTLQTFDATASGVYYVRNNTGGCYSSSLPVTVTISPCGGPIVWEGDISSDWNTPGNWNTGAIPTNTSDVFINAVTTPNVYPVLAAGSNGICRNLNLGASTMLTIDIGKSIAVVGHVNSSAGAIINGLGMIHLNGTSAQTLTGSLTYPILRIENNAGVTNTSGIQTITQALELKSGTFTTNNLVTLKSTAAATAYLDNFSSGFTGSLSGNITVQRFIAGGTGYRYFSSPIDAASNLNVTHLGGFVSGLNGVVFDPDNTPSSAGFPTCWVYNENDANAVENPNAQWGWVSATNASNLLTPMKGFALNLSGNTTISLTGAPSNGSISPITISNTASSNPTSDGYNLVGNPYPSPISWNALRGLVANAGQFTNVIKYWSNSGQYSGQYADYNGIVGTNGGGDVIPLGQAIMIRRTAAGIGSFTLNNTARVASSTGSFFQTDMVPNLLKLRISGGAGNDEMAVYFDSNASNSYDENQDAEKMLSGLPGIPNIYSINTNLRLSINALGALTSNTEVPLGLTITSPAVYTISATDFDSFDPSSMLYLEDRITNTFYNLRVQSSISFTLPAGEVANRFYLHFYLPVQVVSHQETCSNNDGFIEIQNPSGLDWTIELINSSGETIHTELLTTSEFNSAPLADGIYVIRLTSNDDFTVTMNASIEAGLPLNSDFNLSTSTLVELEEVHFESTTFTPNASYLWSFGDGFFANTTQTATHTYMQPGIYEVKLVVSQGHCESTSTETIQVSALTTGLNAPEKRVNYIYPNPASDILSISINNDEIYDWLEIHDLSGRILRKELISGMSQQQIGISVRDLAPGAYVLTLKSAKKTNTHQFSVLR